MAAAVLVLTTVPDAASARLLARSLVQRRLAACVTVKPGAVSYYRWKGKLERAKETLLFIKSVQRNFSGIRKHLEANHPYELPEIIAVPVVKGSKKYLAWVRENTGR